MDDFQIAKLEKFMSDKVMEGAVFDILLKFFLKPKPNAYVNEQAASFLAVGQLQDAWKEMDNYKTKVEKAEKTGGNPGL